MDNILVTGDRSYHNSDIKYYYFFFNLSKTCKEMTVIKFPLQLHITCLYKFFGNRNQDDQHIL